MAKIFVCGAGTFGTALATLTANQGHDVTLWAYLEQERDQLLQTRENPLLKGVHIPEGVQITHEMEPAADCDSAENPDAREPHRRADYTGIDQVPFDLLQDDDKYQEADCLDRIYGKDHKCADKCAQICSDYRKQGGSADQRSHHGGIRKAEKEHS